MRRFASFFLTLLLVLTLATSAMAAPTVTYVGGAERYIDIPGGDLFSDFKDVMPGNSITQQITVKNDTDADIKVSLRSLGADEAAKALLSQMTLKVQSKDGTEFLNETELLLGADEWKPLGTIPAGKDEIVLDLTLEVPVTMGNEFQNMSGTITWEFAVEEIPEPTTEPTDPSDSSDGIPTGDNSNLLLYVALMLLSLLALILLLTQRKKKTT